MKTHPFFGVQLVPNPKKLPYMGYVISVMPKAEDSVEIPLHTSEFEETIETKRWSNAPISTTMCSFTTNDSIGEFTTLIDAENFYLNEIIKATKFYKSNTTIRNWHWNTGCCDDNLAPLNILVNRQANIIATRTLRGVGNVVIASDDAINLLENGDYSCFVRNEDKLENDTNLQYIGLLHNSKLVYRHKDWDKFYPVVILYKGPGEVDAGAFLMPGNQYRIVPNNFSIGSYLNYTGAVRLVESY